MMANNDYIDSIKGILIPGKANRELIIDGIGVFVEIIPELAESLQNNLDTNMTDHFIQNMQTALSLLNSVYARWIAVEAKAILKAAEKGEFEECRKMTALFITELLSLSIDMQVAREKAENRSISRKNDIDTYADIVKNVTAIGKLVAESECREALDIISDMPNLSGDEIACKLSGALAREESGLAVEFAGELRQQYINLINRLSISEKSSEQRILAVDDRPEILASVGRILKKNYKVLFALSGTDAIKIISEYKPDLFLLDIEMPDMDGFTLSNIIRSYDGYADTPIIFLTSNAKSDCVIRALHCGGTDFIVKPAGKNTLLAKVARYLI